MPTSPYLPLELTGAEGGMGVGESPDMLPLNVPWEMRESRRNNLLLFDSFIDLSDPVSPDAAGGVDATPKANMTECVPVPSSEHVAEIVGRQGCKIKALRSKTNTYIKTPVRGEEPVFVVTGRREDVMRARNEIVSAADHFSSIRAARRPNNHLALYYNRNQPGHITRKVTVPYQVVGLIVGNKGSTIKKIQQHSKTYIVTPGKDKEPTFDITGLPENIEKAMDMIKSCLIERIGNDNPGYSQLHITELSDNRVCISPNGLSSNSTTRNILSSPGSMASNLVNRASNYIPVGKAPGSRSLLVSNFTNHKEEDLAGNGQDVFYNPGAFTPSCMQQTYAPMCFDDLDASFELLRRQVCNDTKAVGGAISPGANIVNLASSPPPVTIIDDTINSNGHVSLSSLSSGLYFESLYDNNRDLNLKVRYSRPSLDDFKNPDKRDSAVPISGFAGSSSSNSPETSSREATPPPDYRYCIKCCFPTVGKYVCDPCGHSSFCNSCVERITETRKCVICEKIITSVKIMETWTL